MDDRDVQTQQPDVTSPAPAAPDTQDPAAPASGGSITLSLDSLDWPAGVVDLQYELVQLPSGAMVRVDHHVTYGELLVAALLLLLLVTQLGRALFDRIREVL